MRYRAEIDGLRAVAVVPVVLFHAGFELFSGGFIGVDVFFVISGYLITTLLIEDIENNCFSLANFYERRARRILPALFFVMLVCVPFAWMWMLPIQIEGFLQSLVAVSLFASNVFFWSESGYFDAAAEEKPLLHTWSLAVEEQFYILFPIFLFLVWRFGKDRVFWLVVAFAGISLLVSEWGWRHKAAANFYFAHTRAWELLAGSIAAFLARERGVQKNEILSLGGLAAIVCSIFVYDEMTPFPSVYSLVPVVGTVLLILFADKETFVARMLGLKPIVGIGLISYSAYLWHQPLFAFVRIRFLEEPPVLLMVTLSLSSFLLAVASWKYIECPFRKKALASKKTILLSSLAGVLIFLSIGLIGGLKSRNIEEYWLSQKSTEFQHVYSLINASNAGNSNWQSSSGGIQRLAPCRFNVRELNREVKDSLNACHKILGGGVLVLGDSHAIDLFGVIASRFENSFLVGITQDGCRPHENHSYCQYDDVKEFLSDSPYVFDLIIYEQAGFYFLQEISGKKGSRKMFSGLSLSDAVENVVIDTQHVYATAQFLYELSEFVPVKWFLPRAEPHISVNVILEKGCEYKYSYRRNQYEIFESLDTYIEEYVADIFSPNVITLSQNEIFSFDFPSDFMTCNTIFWSDGDHLSAEGEEHFGKRLPSDFLKP